MRPGAGRPKGRRDNATIAKEKATQEAIASVTKDLTPEDIERLTPLAVILLAMRAEATAGDWKSAAAIAEKAMPYLHAKKAAELPERMMPAELMPGDGRDDEPPILADEPAPPGGVVH